MPRLILLLLMITFFLKCSALNKSYFHNIETAFELLYDNHASLYLKFLRSPDQADQFYISSNDSFIDYLDLSNHEIQYDKLKKNTSYTIYMESSYDHIPVYSFTTSYNNGNPIYVSDQLLKILSKYDYIKEPPPFYSYITAIDDSSITDAEILSFIQKFYLKGHVLNIEDGQRFPLLKDIPFPHSGDCNCEYILNISQHPGISALSNPFPNYHSSNGKINWDTKSRYWYSTAWLGPVKYQKLNSEGKRSHSKSYDYSSTGFGDKSSKFFELGYLLRCLNYIDVPDGCSCKKQVKLKYQYDVNIETKHKLPKCFLCGSKGSEVSGEDWAVLTHSIGDSITYTMDAGNARLESHCKANWNKDWWLNIIDFASSIALVVTGDSSNSSLISTIGNGIKSIIKTSFYSKIGCNAGNQDGNLLLGSQSFNIEANKENWIRLFSYSAAHVKGYTSWENHVNISSNAMLSSIIPGPAIHDIGGICCSDQLASYIFSSFPKSPTPFSDLYSLVKGHQDLYNPWYTQTIPFAGIGVRTGPPPDDCEKMETHYYEAGKWDVEFPHSIASLQCSISNNSLILTGNYNSDDLYYHVWDINGRLLLDGSGSHKESIISKEVESLPTLFFVTVQSEQHHQSFKIINH
ncbi:MAG: hypothetical protein HKN22_08095 [Bacteroidia bacterium]|nr:hypothetical protein [Bacteroidia bacterium]